MSHILISIDIFWFKSKFTQDAKIVACMSVVGDMVYMGHI